MIRKANKKQFAKDSSKSVPIPVNMDEVVTRRILSEEMVIQRKEYERYVGALAENFQSKLDSIVEVVVAAEDMASIKEWIKEDHYNTHLVINSRRSALEVLTGGTA
jgi:hypothetical protein